MSRLTGRQRLLAAALGLAVLVGVVDRLRGGPAPAQADPTSQPAAAGALPAPLPADWNSVRKLVAQLTEAHYAPLDVELAALERDLFARPATAPEVGAAGADPQTQPAAGAATAKPGFAEKHKLLGVFLARQPVAVVDDQLLVTGAELDGHRLVRVSRDCVEFAPSAGGKTVVLELAGPGERTPPAATTAPAGPTPSDACQTDK
ncbi:MAG: hypothetical protein AB1716_15030 [Planctomycetota bacterium]